MIKSLQMAAVVISLSVAGAVLACSIDGKSGFLPENDMYIPVGLKGINGGLTEAQFDSAIDKVVAVYEPIVANMGAKLVVDRKWTDGTVNAYAQQSGKTWSIAMFGGLARHKAITEDGMSLVVCHELGHHLGGAPKKGATPPSGGWWGGNTGGGAVNKWAGTEGQSDYFATLKCLRKVFLNDNNAKIISQMTVPKALTDACKKTTKNNKLDTAICVRASMAGKSVADLFADGKPEVKFETPDKNVVKSTFESHPKAQCRLDTYFQGALCDVGMNEDVSQTDEVKATCHPSLGFKVGTRPLCWFKPKASKF